VANGDIVNAKKIAQFSGEEVTSEIIQRAYEAQLEKNGYVDSGTNSRDGELPNEDLVTRSYYRIVESHRNNWINVIESLKKQLG